MVADTTLRHRDEQTQTVPPAVMRGLTVGDVAQRYRVSEDKVRTWVRKGELRAINTARVLCGRPRWVIPVEALEAFEKRRQAVPPPVPRRPRRKTNQVDYYPD